MSLFKICSWWSVQCPDINENYDSFSLLCCRFGLQNNEKDYIIIGSHEGHLSVFYPTSSDLSESDQEEQQNILERYKPTDLILEIKLKSPILGLLAGKFSGSTKNENSNQLAVLHPESLCVYNISLVDGVAEHGTQSNFHLIVEHKFNRPAFSFCKGHFGKVKGREFMCVSHILDGALTFYEQDGINYECFLPGDNTIPSVLAYIPRTDSFVRVNSYWELENFSYRDLSQTAAMGKNEISPIWSLSIGEYAIDIRPVQVTNNKTAIMILGERNLLNISDEGKVEFIIRLDYSPKCFYPFVIGWYWESNAKLITAIISESRSLLLYNNSRLVWAAQLEQSPVAVQRSNLNNLPGGIVTLGSNGFLHVGYLGSEPQMFKVPPLNFQEMNFQKAQTELIELEKEIKLGIDLSDSNSFNVIANNDFEFHFEINPSLEPNTFANAESGDLETTLKSEENSSQFMCSGIINFKTKVDLEQIQILLYLSDGIICSPESLFTYNNLAAGSQEVIQVWFYPALSEQIDFHIPSLRVEAIASFINKQNIPRVLNRNALLPLGIIFQNSFPQREGSIKLTLNVNLNGQGATGNIFDNDSRTGKLSSIFSDFIKDNNQMKKDTQAIGFSSLLVPGDIVTVVAAKNTNRIRIQSDCLEVITPILEAIISFVEKESNSLADEAKLNYSDSSKSNRKSIRRGKKQKKNLIVLPNLPISEIVKRIHSHYTIQDEIKKQTSVMDALWNQFKLFQRSLQSKKEDEPVDGIMMLIEKNYDDLILEGDKLVNLRREDRRIRNNLSCAINFTTFAISYFDIDTTITESLRSVLTVPIEDWTEMNWEKSVAPAVELLIHNGPLSRNSSKNNDVASIGTINNNNNKSNITLGATTAGANALHSSSDDQFDFDRFKRHMTSLIDRVCRLSTSSTISAGDSRQHQQIVAPSSISSSSVTKNTRKASRQGDDDENKNIIDDATIGKQLRDVEGDIDHDVKEKANGGSRMPSYEQKIAIDENLNSKILENRTDENENISDDGENNDEGKDEESEWLNKEIPSTHLGSIPMLT